MAVQVSNQLMRALDELRFQPTPKRVRATLGGQTVVDTTEALLVWEPRRVVPSYAVPAGDVAADLVPSGTDGAEARPVALGDGPPVLDPSTGFGFHTAEGDALDLAHPAGERAGAGFRLSDPEVAGYVVLDYDAFDGWLEEDEPIVGHPHDPFSRIDIRRGSRHVRVEIDGHVLAESSRPRVLFETLLPTRFYLPRDDVLVELHPSPTRSICAYKGEASYWSVDVDGRRVDDVAWSYERPLEESASITGMVCFFNERTDIVVDGRRKERPRTPWSESEPADDG